MNTFFHALHELFKADTRRLHLINLVAGALSTLAFQPFNQSWLIFITFAILFHSWSICSPRQTFINGWFFALGFQVTGVSWLYNSLHVHGGTPALLAITMIIFLSAYLALYPALAGYLVNRLCFRSIALRLLLLYPAAWVVFEWLQGIILTGFDWMQPGYTQIDWPLAGYAPIIGNYGVGMVLMISAAAIVVFIKKYMRRSLLAGGLVVVWGLGLVFNHIDWTEPGGDEIRVALIQGNITQKIKWRPEIRQPTLDLYKRLTFSAGDVDLIVWPETAVPGYVHLLPSFMAEMKERMSHHSADLLLGVFIKDLTTGRYFNSLVNVEGGDYRKRHLVPLGEYFPLRSLMEYFRQWIRVPMSNIAAASDDQIMLTGAGQPLGVSICFEDAFARDVIKDLPEATLLVNVSNDAWFEDSHESYQHHAIARMRALEAGRFMLRSTNTGITSIIGAKGEEVAVAPNFERYVLKAKVQPMQGSTPYVIWGDGLILFLSLSILGFAFYRSKKR